MKLEVFTPITAKESATCRVSGDNVPGYIKVKVNGTFATVLPDEHPGVSDDRRLVFCPPAGRGYDVWTRPEWTKGAQLSFELYDSSDQIRDQVETVTV